MSLNAFFNQKYNTVPTNETKTAAAAAPSAPTQEDLYKQAQYELFAKVAAENNIDLNKLSDAQLDELFARSMGGEKNAGEMPPQFMHAAKGGDKDKDEESKKKKEAEKELEEKKASDLAERIGREAAHAYIDELKKIAAAVEQNNTNSQAKTASISDRIRSAAQTMGAQQSTQVKVASMDQLAGDRAFGMLIEFNKTAAAGQAYDLNDARARLTSVIYEKGLPDSAKIASAGDVEQAISIRALEALELAGYPVQWT